MPDSAERGFGINGDAPTLGSQGSLMQEWYYHIPHPVLTILRPFKLILLLKSRLQFHLALLAKKAHTDGLIPVVTLL